MNFIEVIRALADGKHKAKRNSKSWLQHPEWYIRLTNKDDRCPLDGLRCYVMINGQDIILQEEDYLAEDWVVEEI